MLTLIARHEVKVLAVMTGSLAGFWILTTFTHPVLGVDLAFGFGVFFGIGLVDLARLRQRHG